ncbi:MAG: hypothetical protein U0559_02250 [Anaerolineae bacterium]
MIIRGGMKIAPEEIEALLVEHPKVAEVAVVGITDQRLDDERICAPIAPEKGSVDHHRRTARLLEIQRHGVLQDAEETADRRGAAALIPLAKS